MPKVLILQPCTVPGDEIARHADVNEVVDVPKDDALTLARLGRARFVSRDDDPAKGDLTATADDKDLAKRTAAAIRAERDAAAKSAAASTAPGLADQIAAAVAAALAQRDAAAAAPAV